MSKPQVRLDPDIAEALQRDADRKGTSLNTTANQWLRKSLGLIAPIHAPLAPAAPPASAALVPPRPASCLHPVNRRIGPKCMVCGTVLPVKRGR